ncbi:hypothetical protein [Aquimarina sp. 2201CG14-23]|uniref:hypothetical protein n=1 Tax=Aquimarina mycalae TaxID=3040073 RepID=UPI002477F85D|nr:hypothetical protein [Aquimarina sp. 2201CG14-23]MDH7444690.1 hypothetical protein [Aquimarina sp. 2201CG14-23]
MIGINFKNLAENLIIIVIMLIVGMTGGYYFSLTAAERMLNNQKSLIEAAIKKETTSITNEFNTEIKKLKAKKGSNVDFSVDPTLENTAETNIIKSKDSIKKKKKGLFKRIFGSNKDSK